MKNAICKFRKNLSTCKMQSIEKYKRNKETTEKCILSLTDDINQYKTELLKCKTIESYLEIENKMSNQLDEDVTSNNDFFTCCNKPAKCYDEFIQAKNNFNDSFNRLSILRQYAARFYRTLEQFDTLLESISNTKYLYLKFSIDKNDNLIGFLLDYSGLFYFNSRLTLYGVIGNEFFGKCTNEGRVYMLLHFNLSDTESYLKIDDFFAQIDNLRCRHGTLALEALLEAVNAINHALYIDEDSLYSSNKRAQISYITGSIKPREGRISYKDLYTFYKLNNFICSKGLNRKIEPYIPIYE